jgi:hypothetical protein
MGKLLLDIELELDSCTIGQIELFLNVREMLAPQGSYTVYTMNEGTLNLQIRMSVATSFRNFLLAYWLVLHQN